MFRKLLNFILHIDNKEEMKDNDTYIIAGPGGHIEVDVLKLIETKEFQEMINTPLRGEPKYNA